MVNLNDGLWIGNVDGSLVDWSLNSDFHNSHHNRSLYTKVGRLQLELGKLQAEHHQTLKTKVYDKVVELEQTFPVR